MKTANSQNNSKLWKRVRSALLKAGIILPFGLALNYTLNVVIARILPVEGYGVFAFGQSLGTILALAASMGFSSSMMRFVAAYRSRHEYGALRALVKVSLALTLTAAFTLTSITALLGGALPEHRAELIWSAALAFPLAIDNWRESSMRGLHHTATAILPRQVLLPLFALVAIAAFSFNATKTALGAYVLIFIVVEIFGLLHLRYELTFLRGIKPVKDTAHWIRVSIPMGFVQLGTLGINRWDTVILGAVSGLATAGPYAAASRTALLVNLVKRLIGLVTGPWLAELYHTKQKKKFRQMLVGSCIGASICGLPFYLLVMIFPSDILKIFGATYAEAALPLQILATGQFVNIATGPAGLALSMTNHEGTNLRLTVVAALLSVLSLTVLSVLYGAIGAAISTALVLAGLNFTQLLTCRRLFWLDHNNDG